MDKTPTSTITDPVAMDKTTQEPTPAVCLTCTVTGQSESSTMAERQLVSKGNPSSPRTCHSFNHLETVYCAHPQKGQKRKCHADAGNDVWAEEPRQPLKRHKQEEWKRKLGCEEPNNDHRRYPGEETQYHIKPPEDSESPDVEAVTEAKSVYGHKGSKGPLSYKDLGVQKYHNGPSPGLLFHLQPSVPVNSDSHRGNRVPLDLSKKMKGCVGVHIHVSQAPLIHPDRVSNDILHQQMPMPEAKGRPSKDQKKSPGLDHGLVLTAHMQKEISSALGPGPQDEILSCAFNMAITRADMRTLRDTQWLNDTVINFYMNLLMDRSQSQGYPALYAFSTFFYSKLKSGGYRSVRRWTKAVDLFVKDLLLVPVHLDEHWSLVVTDLREKRIVYLDSMGHKRPDVLELIFHYLQEESKARRNVDLNPLEWKLSSMPAEEIPQQGNHSDCGMFTCKYADYISKGQPMTFSQQHMPLFRQKMVWEILHQTLL